MKSSVVLSLLILLAGCAPEAPEPQADEAPEADEGWRVHEAGPEAGEDHPGSLLLTRRAEAGAVDGFRPRLVLGCDEGATQAYVEWGTRLGVAEVPVAYRLDDAPAQTVRWPASGDGEAAGLWDDGASVPFIRSLLGHDRLSVEVTPEGEGALTSTFALGGLDSLVVRVRELCGWE